MVVRRHMQQQQYNGPMFGGSMQTVPGATFVSGEQLKQTEPVLEGLLGAVTGGVKTGLVFGLGGGTAYNFATAADNIHLMGDSKLTTALKSTLRNHLPWVLGTAAAGAVLGGVIRYTRAKKHNEWAASMMDHVFKQETTEQEGPAPVGKFTQALQNEAAVPKSESILR